MRFFFDKNTCVRTARMLSIYEGRQGHEIRHHDDDKRFNNRSTDVEILKSLYGEDPNRIFVGGDGMILRNNTLPSNFVRSDFILTACFQFPRPATAQVISGKRIRPKLQCWPNWI